MKILDENKVIEITSWARQVEQIIRVESPDVANKISEEIEKLADIKLNVAIVGLLKRGKSTFCNAFLGRNDDVIAPTGHFPVTGVITEFNSGSESEYANVVFADGDTKKISYSEIHDYATEEGNPGNKKNVLRLEVFGNFHIDPEVKLIDMPGDGSINAYHSEIVYKYLPNADVILFLSSVEDPISKRELSLLRKVSYNDMKKVFFVINKIDSCDDEDIEDAVEHNRQTIAQANISIENDFYLVSALNAMEQSGDAGDFDNLVCDVGSFLGGERYDLLLKAFYARVLALAEPIVKNIVQKQQLFQANEEEIREKIENLEIQKKNMLEEFQKGSREFSDKWDNMIDEFESQLPQIRERIEQKLVDDISATSSLFLSQKDIDRMPEKISSTIEHELETQCGVFTKEAESALENFERSCPNISKFLSEQNTDIRVDNFGSGVGGWIFTLASGSASYFTGAAINTAFAVGGTWGGVGFWGTICAIAGKATGIAAGTITAAVLGPLFLISTAGATLGLGGLLFSILRKKQLQKKQLLNEVKSGIKSSFDAIKMQRIPYLRQQKQVLLDSLNKELNQKINTLEDNLKEALEQKELNCSNTLIAEQRKQLVIEYQELSQEAMENIK